MDTITNGDFSITQPGKKTKFSFQLPVTYDIDFVEEWNRAKKNIVFKEKFTKDRAEYNKLNRRKRKKKK